MRRPLALLLDAGGRGIVVTSWIPRDLPHRPRVEGGDSLSFLVGKHEYSV